MSEELNKTKKEINKEEKKETQKGVTIVKKQLREKEADNLNPFILTEIDKIDKVLFQLDPEKDSERYEKLLLIKDKLLNQMQEIKDEVKKEDKKLKVLELVLKYAMPILGTAGTIWLYRKMDDPSRDGQQLNQKVGNMLSFKN